MQFLSAGRAANFVFFVDNAKVRIFHCGSRILHKKYFIFLGHKGVRHFCVLFEVDTFAVMMVKVKMVKIENGLSKSATIYKYSIYI